MKAILKYDYKYENQLDLGGNHIEFSNNEEYEVIARIQHTNWYDGELIVILNRRGQTMSVSSHPDYVTLIEDDQELTTKLRYDGIEHVEINKQGE